MAYGDLAWRTSRLWLSPITFLLTRARVYGRDRMPATGGCVLAINHLAWVDIPVVGSLSPRNINFVAKIELARVPGVGPFFAWHGIVSIRRGESDRDAVRLMRRYAAEGRAIGVFVEGTRQRGGRPGQVQPGAAMVAIQEDVPVVPIAVYGTQFWKPGNFAPCSIAIGEPFRFEGTAKGGRGYKEASVEIERRLNVLFDWLAGVHARGRPRGETPPL
ncbi:MAG TPA: lysophospholipid acyltransferase family protein [Gaiellaceae bacterium]|nr:lysophospholipid acyltransferase family protein [Gaiellaceae bacterium]